jgi:hypothetical protein
MSWLAPGPVRVAPSPFQKLTADMGLSNQAAEAIRSVGGTYLSTCRPDYSMVTDRGHILSTLPPGSLRAAAILSDPVWIAGRNHAPIWAGYRIPVTKAPSKPIWEQTDRRIQMEIKKTDCKPMQKLLRRTTLWYESFPSPPVNPLLWEDRNSRLEALQEELLKVAEETLLKKKKKPSPGRFFFEDFPVPLQLLKIHLHTLVRLRKILDVPLSYHFYNPDGRVKGPRLRRYLKTLSSWRDHAPAMHASMSEEDQILNPLDGDTSRGADFWFKVRNIDKMRDLLRLDIRHLEKRAKGTVRSIRSASIQAHVEKRQERLTSGRMRAALASLLGKYKNVFLYDTLQCEDGSFDADPIVIHRTLQRYYMKYFSVVPESSLQTLALDLPLWGSIPIWETFLYNADAMVEAYCRLPNKLPPTRIPEVYVRAIAEAFVWTPDAIALEADITESFRIRFSFDEFLYSLGCGGALPPAALRRPTDSSKLRLRPSCMRFLSSYKNSGRRCQGERLRISKRMSFLSSFKRTRPSQRGWANSNRLALSRFSAKCGPKW